MDESRFQVQLVIDTKTSHFLSADTINLIFEQDEIQSVRKDSRAGRYTCHQCKEVVHLQSRRNDNSRHQHTYFFRHPSGTGMDCPWKSNYVGEGFIYNGIQEGNLHQKMKALIRDTLVYLPKWEVVDVDKRFIFSEDRLSKAKPVIHARYNGEDVVFEVQLRSEKFETLVKRKEFYKEKGWPLIWISAEGKDIVSEDFSEDCINTKQVHKDIAFLDRGNWLIFNEDISKLSIENQKLNLLVKFWSPSVVNNKIEYDWYDEVISFEQLQFETGDTYYQDFFQQDSKLKSDLRLSGLEETKELLNTTKSPDFERFLIDAKKLWPTLDYNVDGELVKNLWEENYSKRILKLKKQVLSFLQSEEWRDEYSLTRWNEIANKVSHLNFGINKDTPIDIFEKLLLILGYSLSEYLNPKRKSHIQACHYFLDIDKHKKFEKYQPLCERAIELSIFRSQINNDKTIIKRESKRNQVKPIRTDLDDLFNWFISPPLLAP